VPHRVGLNGFATETCLSELIGKRLQLNPLAVTISYVLGMVVGGGGAVRWD